MDEVSNSEESVKIIRCFDGYGDPSNGPDGEPALATRRIRPDNSVVVSETWRQSRTQLVEVSIEEVYNPDGTFYHGSCHVEGDASYEWDGETFWRYESFGQEEILARPLECFLFYEYFESE
jgi:hypothetical protein